MTPVDEWIRDEHWEIRFNHPALHCKFLERYLADTPIGPASEFAFMTLLSAESSLTALAEDVLDLDALDQRKRLIACTALVQMLLSRMSYDGMPFDGICSSLLTRITSPTAIVDQMILCRLAINNLWNYPDVRSACRQSVVQAVKLCNGPSLDQDTLSKSKCLGLITQVFLAYKLWSKEVNSIFEDSE